MKLRELFTLIENIADANSISDPKICGGTVRDKVIGNIKDNFSDIDITTGDKTINNLAKETEIELSKNYNIKVKQADDGHRSIFLGNLKIDFSSNFVNPGIENILLKKGIKNPTDMQKEMYSRDFTCNSLLMTLDLKTIQDPLHQGIKDIKDKILKTCLDPNITLKYNTNRIVRVIYLSSKLDFDIDPKIIEFISKNKDLVRLSSDQYLIKNLNKAMDKNPERAVYLINKIDLWDVIPIVDKLHPYYAKRSPTKIALINKIDKFYSMSKK